LTFILTLRRPSFRFKLALLSLLSIIIGMFLSRAMMSIGMILIGLQFFFKEDIADTFKIYFKDKVLFLWSFIFLIYLISVLYTEHLEAFGPRISIKLPLLFMPLGFAALKEMPEKYFHHVLYAFVWLCFFTAITSIGLYIANYEEITENYKYAKVIPNIFNMSHTRLSLMLVTAVFSALHLYRKEYSLFNFRKIEKYFIAFAGIFILGFIHLLSVRSGLLAFYASCLVLVVSNMVLQRKYISGTILLGLIILMPLLAYKIGPTVHNKIDYMITDVGRFLKGEDVNQWSDGNRLLSIKIGIEVGKKSPMVGVGIGDVESEMFAYYSKYYPEIWKELQLTPHNQFVYVFTTCGLIGLLVFIIVAFYPLVVQVTYKSMLFLTVVVSMLTSYLSEATLENQLGVCLLITFYLIGWQCGAEPKTEQN
jgi:O-antigen ligase